MVKDVDTKKLEPKDVEAILAQVNQNEEGKLCLGGIAERDLFLGMVRYLAASQGEKDFLERLRVGHELPIRVQKALIDTLGEDRQEADGSWRRDMPVQFWSWALPASRGERHRWISDAMDQGSSDAEAEEKAGWASEEWRLAAKAEMDAMDIEEKSAVFCLDIVEESRRSRKKVADMVPKVFLRAMEALGDTHDPRAGYCFVSIFRGVRGEAHWITQFSDEEFRHMWALAHRLSGQRIAFQLHVEILRKSDLGRRFEGAGCTTTPEERTKALQLAIDSGEDGSVISFDQDLVYAKEFFWNSEKMDANAILRKASWQDLRFLARTQGGEVLLDALKGLSIPQDDFDALVTRAFRMALAGHIDTPEAREIFQRDEDGIVEYLGEHGQEFQSRAEAFYGNMALSVEVHNGTVEGDLSPFYSTDLRMLGLFWADILASSEIHDEIRQLMLKTWPSVGIYLSTMPGGSFDVERWKSEYLGKVKGSIRRDWYWSKAIGKIRELLGDPVELDSMENAGDAFDENILINLVLGKMSYLAELVKKYPRLRPLVPAAIYYLVAEEGWKLSNDDIRGLKEREVIARLVNASRVAFGYDERELSEGFKSWLEGAERDFYAPYVEVDRLLDQEEAQGGLAVENGGDQEVGPKVEKSSWDTYRPWGTDKESEVKLLLDVVEVDDDTEHDHLTLNDRWENGPWFAPAMNVVAPLLMADVGAECGSDLVRRMENPIVSAIAIEAMRRDDERHLVPGILKNSDAVLRLLARRMADLEWLNGARRMTLSQRRARRNELLDELQKSVARALSQFQKELGAIEDARRAVPELFSGRLSLAHELEISDEWHRQFGHLPQKEAFSRAWKDYMHFPKVSLPGYWDTRVQIVRLEDSADLLFEGEALGHCVGTYAEGCAHGESIIYSIRDGEGQRIGTLELSAAGEIEQLYGKKNAELSPEIRSWLIPLIEKLVFDAKVRSYLESPREAGEHGELQQHLTQAVRSGRALEDVAREIEAQVGPNLQEAALFWLASLGRERTSPSDRAWLEGRNDFEGKVGNFRECVAYEALSRMNLGGFAEARRYVRETLPCEPEFFDALLIERAGPRDRETPEFQEMLSGESDLPQEARKVRRARAKEIIARYEAMGTHKAPERAPSLVGEAQTEPDVSNKKQLHGS